MRWSWFLVIACAVGALATAPQKNIFGNIFRGPPPPPVSNARVNARLIQDRRISQKLDHFNEGNTQTWEMRYLSNSQHYAPGGPLFIFVGGEWTVDYSFIMGGHMFDMAEQMNGYLFYTEHRYYGQSFPTSDASTDNLKYLNVNQALADLAHFIDVQRATLPGAQNAGVILVGGSYSATMVTWFKQRYPDKVNGVWASSAPVYALEDFIQYKSVVSDTIKNLGPAGCAERIERAIASLESDVEAGDTTRITKDFNLCTDFTASDVLNVQAFFSSISNIFSGLVQYHRPGDIDATCGIILSPTVADDVQALANFVNLIFGPASCLDIAYQSTVDFYKEESWESDATIGASRQWFYQTCNEFGWYQTSSADNHIFGSSFPIDLYASLCSDIYGIFDLAKIKENVSKTNNDHNGFVPEVENVFFTHGEHDPWRPLGIQEALNDKTQAVVLKGYAHCQDLYSISSEDSEQMIATKLEITRNVRNWLGME